MKNSAFLLVNFLFMVLTSFLLAQEMPTIIPPSPEAASLGKFTEVPVSHYTGVPNISVPITSFSVGHKSFPVNLSYHARGIRVDEIASRVGLGWALDAGGQITRQVRHKADDGFTGFFSKWLDIHDLVFTNGAGATQGPTPNPSRDLATDLANEFIETSDYDFDKIPDVFTLQGGGLSSKFIFNYDNGKPLVQKYDDILIEHKMGTGDINGIAGFIVTDKEGYKYYYGIDSTEQTDTLIVADVDWTQKKYTLKADQTYDLVDPAMQNVSMANEWSLYPYFNAWHLREIVSPNGKVAKLIYNKETSYVYRRSGDKFNTGSPANEQLHNYTNLVRVEQHQLQEIRFNYDGTGDYEKVVFQAGDLRNDMFFSGDDHIDGTSDAWPSDASELDAIKLYDRHNALITSYDLSHSYSVSDDNIGPNYNYHSLLGSMNPSARRRLVLDSITEIGQGTQAKPPYKFFYNTTKLPNRHSNSKDYWGYYNGKANGQFLCGYGLDRRVDTTLSEAGMLEKITYPTGGSTRFAYEHNKGHKGSEFNNVWLPNYNGIFLPKINPSSESGIGLSNIGFGNGLYNQTGGIYGGYYKTEKFNVTSSSEFRFNVQLPEWDGEDQNTACVQTPLATCNFVIRLVPIDGNGLPDTTNSVSIWTDSTPITIAAGEYQLEVHVPNGWNPEAQADTGQFFNVGLYWDDQVADQGTLLYAGGKRIKQIEFLDSGDNVVSKKTYDYHDSGIILGITDFTYSVTVDLGAGPVETSLAPFHLYSTYQSNSIGYKIVTEYFGDKENNSGKRSYNFLVTKDTGDFIGNPLTPPTDNEWLRGLPLQIIDYKNNGDGTYSRVKQVDNDYLVTNDNFRNVLPLPLEFPGGLPNPILTPESQYYMLDGTLSANIDPTPVIPTTSNLPDIFYQRTGVNFRIPFVAAYWQNYIHFTDPQTGGIMRRRKIKIFHFTGGTLDTGKTVETLYDNNENPTLVTETETTYDYNNHYQPSMVTSVTSDGIPVIQTFTYPQSIAAGNRSAAEQELVDQNRLIPIETKTYRDENLDGFPGFAAPGELKSTTKTTYTDWGSGIVEPSLIQTSKGTDPLQDRIEFKDYDSDGNILQVSKTDGMDITYIYGYDNTLPVAKIENATYAQVQSYVANIQNKSDLDDDRCMDSGSCDEKNLRTALNALRSAVPGAMVTTYTYDPLIGITSMTDPKGYTIYYEYDDLNRLVRVKDADGYIMSENKYHYLLDN